MKEDTFQFNGDIPKDILFGVGYDIHRLIFGEKIVLCGVKIPFDRAFDAHSDGDVPLHAVMDAILSSLGQKDIGHLFPVNDDNYKGADSASLLKKVLTIANEKGYTVFNASVVVIAERPKLAPYIDDMKTALANILNIPTSRVGITATTNEGVGVLGKEEAIAAFAVVSLEKIK